MKLHRFRCSELPATPWKNGGGTTCEIACWPPGAGLADFDWRVSIARIAAPGPFSRFAGVARTIVLLDGDGVRLRAGDAAIDHRLDAPLVPFDFAGEVALDCELLGRESRDFNVMTRRGRVDAETQVVRAAAAFAPAAAALLLAWRGSWNLALRDAAGRALPAIGLAPGDGVWWGGAIEGNAAGADLGDDAAGSATVEADGDDAALIAVRFTPAGPTPQAPTNSGVAR